MDMKTITTYKGVVLKENTPIKGFLGNCPYAVYLTNGNHCQFSSVAEFKRVVNATDPSLGVMELGTDGKWLGKGVRQAEFREYALKNQITDGIKFKRPEDCELFSIFEEDGKKYVRIEGYAWNANGERDWKDYNEEYGTRHSNERNGFWVLTEYSDFEMPIEEFIAHKDDPDYFFEEGSECQQYEGGYTAKEIVETLNSYFEGHGPVARVLYTEVTLDTPCGAYVA